MPLPLSFYGMNPASIFLLSQLGDADNCITFVIQISDLMHAGIPLIEIGSTVIEFRYEALIFYYNNKPLRMILIHFYFKESVSVYI